MIMVIDQRRRMNNDSGMMGISDTNVKNVLDVWMMFDAVYFVNSNSDDSDTNYKC